MCPSKLEEVGAQARHHKLKVDASKYYFAEPDSCPLQIGTFPDILK